MKRRYCRSMRRGNMETKRCSKCGEVKEVGDFYRHYNTKDKLRGKCKTCMNESSKTYQKTYQKTHHRKTYYYPKSVERKEYEKNWRLLNRDKARIYRNKYNKKTVDGLFDSYIKSKLVSKSSLKCCDIPKDLIEVKRLQMMLKREIRNDRNKNNQ